MKTITQIQLLGDNQGYLDVAENTSVPLNFSVAEIRDVSKKKGTFSKSITLPGSKRNNQLLGYYFDVNIQAGTFNINKLQYCSIIQNGVTVLDNALLQLVSVNKSQENNNYDDKVTYTVLVKDSTSDFFSTISNRYLTDISGFTWMNHIYNADNVIASFSNTVEDGYKYVMPFNPESTNDAMFDLKEFTPGIYVKTYFDKIFSNAGYTYSWPEALSDTIRFDKLIIPYNGDVLRTTKSESDIYYVNVLKTSATTLTSTTSTNQFYLNNNDTISSSPNEKITFNTEVVDGENLFNLTTNTYTTPPVFGSQNQLEYEYDIDYEVYVKNDNGANRYLVGTYKPYSSSPNFASLEDLVLNPKVSLVTTANSGIIYNDIITTNKQGISLQNFSVIAPGITMLSSGTTTIKEDVFTIDPNKELQLNSELQIQTKYNNLHTYYNFRTTSSLTGPIATDVKFYYKIKSVNLRIKTFVDSEYGFNVKIDMQRFIPEKIKQSEFIKSIFTMFNCYVELDKEKASQLNIITRDKYYDDGKINDWSKKLIKDMDQDITFLPDLTSKKIILTYKQDEDFANKNYFNATKEVYGQLEYTFDSQYAKDITKQELIFSPTPMFTTSFGAVCPMWLGGSPKCNLRILLDGGEYATTSSYSIANWWVDTTSNDTVVANSYPHISHWDRPRNPTFDINFALCDYYYRTDDFGSNTNNNLFNLHWRRTFNQINNGKLMTAYFNLNEADIQSLSMNDKIYVDNSWWNINKINDYNANSNSPTKVELISIDDNLKIPFNTRQTTTLQRNSSSFDAINKTTVERNAFLSTNLSNGTIVNNGKYNYIAPSTTFATIIGDNNSVSDNTLVFGNNNSVNNNTMVIGDNNSIDPQTSNIMIVGNGVSATTSNTLYVDNLVIGTGGTINNINISQVVSGATVFEPGSGLNSVQQVGSTNVASGTLALAEGNQTTASGNYSHSQGQTTIASGSSSHSEGQNTIAGGARSHSEGQNTQALGLYSHSEGGFTQAIGIGTHSEGHTTQAIGDYSHSGGDTSIANGLTSFIHSSNSQVDGDRSVVLGGQNITGATDDTVYVPNLNINYTPASGSTGDTLLLRSANGDIKQITMADLATIIGSGATMEQELIINFEYIYGGANTYTIVKDDLNYGTGMTLNLTDTGTSLLFDFDNSFTGNKLIPKLFHTESIYFSNIGIDRIYIEYGTNTKRIRLTSYTNTIGYSYKFTIIFRALP